MCKDHHSTFCKHLLVCDATLGLGFFKEIQVHYDMNSELEMFIKKLQMFAYSYTCVSKAKALLAQTME